MPPTKTTPGLRFQALAAPGERPFPSYPQIARYFPSTAIEGARLRLSRSIERGDGPGLVIGAAGTGKSLLLQVLAAQYHDRFDVVLLACARFCTRRALLQAILFELGLSYGCRDEGPLRLSLLDQLLSVEQSPGGLLLLVDEAQSLPISLLEELRMLTNLAHDGVPRVRLVLAGSPSLEETFASPELESLSQRLAARTYLAPLTHDETLQFVRAQIAASGVTADEAFDADALDAVFEATDGVPRLVNQLCDRALLLADGEGRDCVDREVVQTAWTDLQQLPAPWVAPGSADFPPAGERSSVIEFSGLDELADDAAVERMHDEPPTSELEPTELDEPDGDEAAGTFADHAPEVESLSASGQAEDGTPRTLTSGPFAEEFDEEVVVLDHFAAWDQAFRDRTPRVHNACDREFSARVHAAMTRAEQPPEEPEPLAASGEGAALVVEEDTTFEDAEPNWPPIRLAVVPGTATTDVTAADFASSDRSSAASTADDEACAEGATLLVDEDVASIRPRQPSAHRENYRHLFSRLRSG